MPSLIGTSPNQVPTNGLLGGMAFQDPQSVKITGGEVTGVTQNGYELVNQGDIGVEPNQIPLNQYLGNLAYQNSQNIAGNVGVGGQLALPAGTANGVLYLNGSKAATSGSALTFDGTNFKINTSGTLQVGNTAGTDRFNVAPNVPGSGATIYSTNFAGNAYSLLYFDASQFVFRPNSTEAMLLDASGNLGLGVTPSAWGGYRALQVNNASMSSAAATSIVLSANTYNANGTGWKYISTAAATQYEQFNGGHYWSNAPSGTAGNTVSFTQAMTLDTNGNLGLGVTPSAWGSGGHIDVAGGTGLYSQGASVDVGANWYYNGSSFVYKTTAAASWYNQAAGVHKWFTTPSGTAGNPISFTQAMTLDANGYLLVGKLAENVNVNGFQALSNGVFASTASFAYTGGENLILHRQTTAGNFVTCVYNGSIVGAITTSGTATSYNTSSDYRLKDNQAPLTGSGSFIDALKPKTWTWKADGTKGVGFIAHEVQEVSPASVVGEKDAMRIEQYEVSPATPATYDDEGNELTPAVEAVMGEREVPAYQAMEYGSAEFIANIVAELQSLRKRVAALEGAAA